MIDFSSEHEKNRLRISYYFSFYIEKFTDTYQVDDAELYYILYKTVLLLEFIKGEKLKDWKMLAIEDFEKVKDKLKEKKVGNGIF